MAESYGGRGAIGPDRTILPVMCAIPRFGPIDPAVPVAASPALPSLPSFRRIVVEPQDLRVSRDRVGPHAAGGTEIHVW